MFFLLNLKFHDSKCHDYEGKRLKTAIPTHIQRRVAMLCMLIFKEFDERKDISSLKEKERIF